MERLSIRAMVEEANATLLVADAATDKLVRAATFLRQQSSERVPVQWDRQDSAFVGRQVKNDQRAVVTNSDDVGSDNFVHLSSCQLKKNLG
jgi:hypothetical protein